VRTVSIVGTRALARLEDEPGAFAIDLHTGRVERDLVPFADVPDLVVTPDDP
jgi:hypothetical protein